MARQKKCGLSYAPQDTDIHSDRKIRRLITEFGATGYLVYDYVKCLCYKENGYWMKYDDGFCFDVADVLKSGTTENSVLEILKGCFRMSLFDSEVFRMSRIITSAGIQKRFLEVRKNEVIDEKLKVKYENEDLSTENDLLNDKVKESKGNEIKVKERKDAFKALLEPFRVQYSDEMLIDFGKYWCETTRSGRLKWEIEETWELHLRLQRWSRNQDKFDKRLKL